MSFFSGTSSVFTDDIDVRRLNENGEMIWQYHYGTNDNEFVNNMLSLDEEHLIICGDATNSLGDMDGFLLMIDTSGDQMWRTDEGIAGRNEDFYGMHIAANGDILVAGFISAFSGTGNDILVARYDQEGNQIWRTTWGEDVNDYAMGITETPGGTIFVSADRFIDGIGYNPLIAALSSEGSLLWELPLDIPYNSGCKTLRLNSIGKLMLTGESGTIASPVFDVLLAQIDTSGALDWVQWIGDVEGGEAGYDLAEVADGTYLITGFGYHSETENNDILVVHADADGNELSRAYYGDLIVDYAYDVQTDAEGNYWVSGFSNVDGITYFALIRNSIGLSNPVQNAQIMPSLQVIPNPAFGEVTVHLPHTEAGRLQLLDQSGRLIKEIIIPQGVNTTSLIFPYAGIWLVRWESQLGTSILKVLSVE